RYLILTAGAAAILFPLAWMLTTSFKPFPEVFSPTFWPKRPTFANYTEVLLRTDYLRWFANSLLVSGGTTLSVLFFDALVGYTLAKMDFPGRNLIFIVILSTLMIPTEMLVIPWFVTSSE